MPAPTAAELTDTARRALAGVGLRGRRIGDLALALGQTCSQALTLFISQAMVLPGIAALAPPPALSGSTAGPGRLLPPPAGGPAAPMLEPLALAALTARELLGSRHSALAAVMAGAIAQGILLFTQAMMVSPGIPIAGLVTTGPGQLTGSLPQQAELQPVVHRLLLAGNLRGEKSDSLAAAIAQVVADSLALFGPRVMVLPGIACSPTATVAPGRLL